MRYLEENMTDVIPLPVYPWKPTGKDLEMLRQAKQNLKSSLLISPEQAVPGSPGRILALRESPNFLCDHALVRNPTVESVQAALAYCLGLNDDPRATTVVKMLRETFGDGVVEIE
jgi:hypothetical protein